MYIGIFMQSWSIPLSSPQISDDSKTKTVIINQHRSTMTIMQQQRQRRKRQRPQCQWSTVTVPSATATMAMVAYLLASGIISSPSAAAVDSVDSYIQADEIQPQQSQRQRQHQHQYQHQHSKYLRSRSRSLQRRQPPKPSPPKPTTGPFVASYSDSTCINNRPPKDWETSHTSLSKCCEAVFSWDVDKCNKNFDRLDLVYPKLNDDEDDAKEAVVYPFIANFNKETCTNTNPPRSTDETYKSLKKCCGNNFKSTMKPCMKAGQAAIQLALIPLEERPRPYLPDYGLHSCTRGSTNNNDWEERRGYDTLQECCDDHFDWSMDKCMGELSVELLQQLEGIADNDDDDDEEEDDDDDWWNVQETSTTDLAPVRKQTYWHPIWAKSHCVTNHDKTPPAYMQNEPEAHMQHTYVDCCNINFPGDEYQVCIDMSSSKAYPTRPPAISALDQQLGSTTTTTGGAVEYKYYYYPIYTSTKCELDGRFAPRYMQRDPITYFMNNRETCCQEHFPEDVVGCVNDSPSFPGNIYEKEDSGGGGGAIQPEPINQHRYKYHYYPSFAQIVCFQNTQLDAPGYMYEDDASVQEFFFMSYDDCCTVSFDMEYKDCMDNSKLGMLGLPLKDYSGLKGDTDDGGDKENEELYEPAILIQFDGKLYFRNVFIPSNTPGNMRIVRDSILNSIKVALVTEGSDHRVVHLEGVNFDGIDLVGLDDLLSSSSGRRSQRDLRQSSMRSQEGHDENISAEEIMKHGRYIIQSNHNVETSASSLSRRKLNRMQLFRFTLSISIPCITNRCANDIKSASRSASLDIASTFEEAISDNFIFDTLKSDMEGMGLVGPFFSASLDEGYLQYDGVEWDTTYTRTPTISPRPTPRPTRRPAFADENNTKRPTRRPSEVPTDMPVKNYPYYPDMVMGTCLSDGRQSEFMQYLYDTLDECCAFPWLNKGECIQQGSGSTIKPTREPTPRPSPQPTTSMPTPLPSPYPSPAPSPKPSRRPSNKPNSGMDGMTEFPTFSPTTEEPTSPRPSVESSSPPSSELGQAGSCSEHGWHIDRSTQKGCTNDDNIIQSWLGASLKKNMFHETSEKCCAAFFKNQECEVKDNGCGQFDVENTNSCGNHGWHVDRINNDGCTNDNNIIDVWLTQPSLKAKMLHSTSKSCCDAFFPGNCKIYDCNNDGETAPTPVAEPEKECDGLGWHVDPVKNDGCSDDDNYIQSWLNENMKDQMFHPTAESCCQMFFPGKDCKIKDTGCGFKSNDPPPAPVSTPEPNNPPPAPAPAPEKNENCSEHGWHVHKTKNDGCSDDSDIVDAWTKPGMLERMFFETSEACCQQFFAGKTCIVSDSGCFQPPAPGPSPPGPDVTAPTSPVPVPEPAKPPSPSNSKPFSEDFEGGDLGKSEFTTEGLPWKIDDEFTANSSKFSVKNTVTKRGESSKLKLRMNFPTDGMLVYELRHDVFMPFASLQVSVDGKIAGVKSNHAGDAKWSTEKVTVKQGENEIMWNVLTNDFPLPPDGNRGTGTVWIDDVQFVGVTTLDFEDDEFDEELFSFSGIGNWRIDNSMPGTDKTGLSAHSPKGLLPGEHSTMEVKWGSPIGGQVTFDMHLGLGKMSFFIDGKLEHTADKPAMGTNKVKVGVPPGEHILSWKYEPPQYANMPMSNVWIDNVTFDIA